ncbi:MAG TPA: GEVED domain-containing protein [Flavobacteriales bacterium]|nr:GEVED domain-containing protein [Flavobacteriales bacterium]
MPTFTTAEPICQVAFADLDHSSSPSSTLATENFTEYQAHVYQGETHQLTVHGSTVGDYTSSIWAYFDWDRDFNFETAIYVGSINNTLCGTPATVNIPVPLNATPGNSRMRIVKYYGIYSPEPNDGCHAGNTGYGQTEDYTVVVQSHYCPMPTFNTLEEICHVVFADIDNTAWVEEGTSTAEDFSDQVAHVTQGESHMLSVWGTLGSIQKSVSTTFCC